MVLYFNQESVTKIHEKCTLVGNRFIELFYCIIFHIIAYSAYETDSKHLGMGIAASQVSGTGSETSLVVRSSTIRFACVLSSTKFY